MIIFINFLLILFLFKFSVYKFIFNHKHLLITLLRLEFIVLSLFFIIFLILIYFNIEIYFSILFLIFRVCEGALGLSLLVSIIRTHRNNYFQSFNILIC